jgi:hypothetical protein
MRSLGDLREFSRTHRRVVDRGSENATAQVQCRTRVRDRLHAASEDTYSTTAESLNYRAHSELLHVGPDDIPLVPRELNTGGRMVDRCRVLGLQKSCRSLDADSECVRRTLVALTVLHTVTTDWPPT